MAVGSDEWPPMYPVQGVRLAAVAANIKYSERLDLVVMELAAGSTIAGTFTQNAFCAAPVRRCREHLSTLSQPVSQPLYFVTNTGNANAGTGAKGEQDTLITCQQLASEVKVPVENVFPFSTGVIGEPLPLNKVLNGIPLALQSLDSEAWHQAATGIMTTDTRPKGASTQISLGDTLVTITGISKGAGMIRPNMATMLAYVFTDVALDQQLLQSLALTATEKSFNAITVDSDTSTNDCCMLVATGGSGVRISVEDKQSLSKFQQALEEIYLSLAQAIVRDGEGATKFVTVKVVRALDNEEAKRVAFTVAHSPLVKTALFASDPNWGRILAAVGRSGIKDLDVNQVGIRLNDFLIAEKGAVAAEYVESQVAPTMQREEIEITVCLGRGNSEATVWTNDLSYDYVKINAEYRT